MTPQLRFPEFVDEWIVTRLKDVSQKGRYGMNAAAKDFDGKNKYLRITDIDEETRRMLVRGITSPNAVLEDKYRLVENDIVFTRTGASTGKTYLYNTDDGRVYFAGFLIKFHINNAVPNFVYAQTLRTAYEKWVTTVSARSGQPGINAEEYSEYKFFKPSIIEQQKIADFLTAVDDKITTLDKKMKLLKQYKKGIMQQIFSQHVRFKDEDGQAYPEWEVRPLKDISDRVTSKNRDNSTTAVLTNSAVQGIVNQNEFFSKDIANQGNLLNYYVVSTDDFVYNPRISEHAPVGPIKRNHIETGVMSPLYSVFRLTSGVLDFYEKYFETKLWHEYMKSVANSGARHDRMNITNADLYDLPLPFPVIKEQQKIAAFLAVLDDKITAEQNRLSAAKEWKKGLMQRMFI